MRTQLFGIDLISKYQSPIKYQSFCRQAERLIYSVLFAFVQWQREEKCTH